MKIVFYAAIGILVFLALSSGVPKILLMKQEVDFFGQYGFTDPILVAFGLAQVISGALLIVPKTRTFGAVLFAITLLISASILALAGSLALCAITLIFVFLSGFVVKFSYGSNRPEI